MVTQKFKVGDTVEFFSRRNTPRRVGKVIWAKGAEPKGSERIWEELLPLDAQRLTYVVRRPLWGYIVEVRGPRGGRKLFAPLEANMQSCL
jgi:hypothetical protein